jgi:hypothetical protein
MAVPQAGAQHPCNAAMANALQHQRSSLRACRNLMRENFPRPEMTALSCPEVRRGNVAILASPAIAHRLSP